LGTDVELEREADAVAVPAIATRPATRAPAVKMRQNGLNDLTSTSLLYLGPDTPDLTDLEETPGDIERTLRVCQREFADNS
jgi:hypothetical protein